MNDTRSTNIKTDFDKQSLFTAQTTLSPHPLSDDNMRSSVCGQVGKKNNFAEFLEGRIDCLQLLKANNYPRLHQQQQEESERQLREKKEAKGLGLFGSLFRFKHKYKHVKTNSEDRNSYLKTKLISLNTLIQSRVKNLKKDNDEKRRRSLQNVQLLKSIVEASENINSKIGKVDVQEKQIPLIKNLKTVTISYDDQKIARKEFLKLKQKSLTSTNPKLFLKTQLEDTSKEFLRELEELNEKKQQNLDKLSRMKLISDNKVQQHHKFNLFVRGVLTYKDIELYDYIHQQPQVVSYRCHFTGQNENQNLVPAIISRKQQLQATKHKKQTTLTEMDNKAILDVSDSSSLQSAYEIHLDNLYSQTREMRKQLLKKQNLPKKIKQMIRLDELERLTLQTSTYKLKH